ncbi:MAG: glycosyltransferase family 4 protein [Nitrospirae bacterium]|nr:glycosyltransferase family 4 protein [Nitrospirota bacterium]
MKILYICDKLITFILNEIIELKKQGHDVLILSEGSRRIHDVITEPILLKNGLDRTYHRFHRFESRKQKYLCFVQTLISDFFTGPLRTVKAFICVLRNYPDPKYGVADYLDVRVFFDSGIDVIHSPFSTPRMIDKVYLLSKTLGVPFTLCFRAHDIYHADNSYEAEKRIDAIMKASKIITIADYNRRHLKSITAMDESVEIIHSAINPGFFKPEDIERSPNSIITAGRLTDEKGIIYLIEACHILNKRKISYECTVIGEGPEKDKYKKLVDELKIPGIKFIDFLPAGEIKEHLNRSTVFVLPCIIAPDGKRDILANVLKEAMAMRLPVITSNICGIEELVDDGINGILVPPQDPEAIADAIEKVLKHPELGRAMGAEGRKTIEEKFNIKIEALKLENNFSNAVNHTCS